ncbi:MAG: hypothetical protein Q4G00_11980 [Clostridia bacterium]|nr:hypothetical protein [Clostridia bacterium]
MKKEKHTVYRLVMVFLVILLLLGIALLIMGLRMGGDRFVLNSWSRM